MDQPNNENFKQRPDRPTQPTQPTQSEQPTGAPGQGAAPAGGPQPGPQSAPQSGPRPGTAGPSAPPAGAYRQPAAVRVPAKQPTRRVGTLTLGVALVAIGVAAILSIVDPKFTMGTFLKFSPAVLILLGAEIIVYSFVYKKEKFRYDGLSILFSLLLVLGSVGGSVAGTLWDEYGPARYEAQQQLEKDVYNQLYNQVANASDVWDVDVYTNLYRLKDGKVPTLDELKDSTNIHVNVTLRSGYANAQEFATACRGILDRFQKTGLPLFSVDFYSYNNSDETSGFELELAGDLQIKMGADQLALKVHNVADDYTDYED